jgi:hypothetical protein
MAQSFVLDQTVFVPSFLIPDGDRQPHSIFRSKVIEIVMRSVRVQLPGGQPSELIATSKVHENLGIAIVSIGDFSTEDSLINPLAKSVLQFCRLLLPDDHVTSVRLRAIGEFGEWWGRNHGAYTHIVLIGHGSNNGITFGVGGERHSQSFARRLSIHGAAAKTFISLCCETGRKPFASEFSKLPFCGTLIAPVHAVHGAVASQFFQSFLGLQLLRAESTTIAFRHANSAIPGQQNFRLWRAGGIVQGKRN